MYSVTKEFTAEHRANLSAAAKRRPKRTLSEEDKAKKSEAAKRRYENPEERERMRLIRRSSQPAHGLVGTGAYTSWYAMKQRVLNPKNKEWHRYGGRGIKVADRWMSFESFYADMGPRPEGMTLDRIDVDGNYEPGNCRWVTWSEQRLNQRRMVAGHGKADKS